MLKVEDIPLFKIPEESVLNLRDKKVGRIAGNIQAGKACDFYMTSLRPQGAILDKIKAENLIIDFYVWDEALKPYYDRFTAIHKFQQLKSLGIVNCVELDFSVFYDVNKLISIYNLYCANQRTKDMVNMGFKVVINSNLITDELWEANDIILPSVINTLVEDNNHTFNKTYIQKELSVTRKIYESGRKIKHVIIIQSKKTADYLLPVLRLYEQNDTTYQIVPARIAIQNAFSRRKFAPIGQ